MKRREAITILVGGVALAATSCEDNNQIWRGKPNGKNLDRVGARRLILGYTNEIKECLEYYRMEAIDKTTMDRVKDSIDEILKKYNDMGAITKYATICGEINNPTEQRDRGILQVNTLVWRGLEVTEIVFKSGHA